jgi:alpha-tubulin suppressor-like RCC1 family protein
VCGSNNRAQNAWYVVAAVRLGGFAFLFLAACQTAAVRGASCTRDDSCAAPLVCALGHCRAACRASRDCETGARCLVEPSTGIGVCSLENVDGCTNGCSTGFVCQTGLCINACDAIGACPDGVCVGGACVPVVGDAGPLPDANVPPDAPDAGTCHGPGCDPIVSLVAYYSHAHAVTAGGFAWSWGESGHNETGDGTTDHDGCVSCAPRPVPVRDATGAPLGGVTSVVASDGGACALMHDGTVMCWGYGLGSNAAGVQGVPSVVQDASGAVVDQVTTLVAGRTHACVIRGAGREVWCWGNEAMQGQLGRGDALGGNYAARATDFTAPAAAIVLGEQNTIVVADDGTAMGVGGDLCGALAVGTTDASVTTAVSMPVGSIASIATSGWDTCALDRAGVVHCWGVSGLDIGMQTPPSAVACTSCALGTMCTLAPVTLALPQGVMFTRIAYSGTYIGMTAAGLYYVWGAGTGVLGDNPPVSLGIQADVPLAGLTSDTQTCILSTAGDVLCAGANDRGQLGRGMVTTTGDMNFGPVLWP